MPRNILLYGADEFLGGLFIGQALSAWTVAGSAPRHHLLIAGRNAALTRSLGQRHQLPVRELDLRQPQLLVQQLEGVDVLVNAAAPFEDTALALARAALRVPCHTIDLNPEVDVFFRLGRLADRAEAARCALVRSAGPGCVASALMVKAALARLQAAGALHDHCLGAIRIGLECVRNFSRGSAASVWRGLSRDVTVMRAETVPLPDGDGAETRMCRDHAPIGLLERSFDFSVNSDGAVPPPKRRLASAANLVDTPACSAELEPGRNLAGSVESYVGFDGDVGRIAYAYGAGLMALGAPLATTAYGRTLQRCSTALLSEAQPTAPARLAHTIVLDIEDQQRTRLVDWRLRTPDFYVSGVRAALAVTEAVAKAAPAGGSFFGLQRPAGLLDDTDLAAAVPKYGAALRDCVLDRRLSP